MTPTHRPLTSLKCQFQMYMLLLNSFKQILLTFSNQCCVIEIKSYQSLQWGGGGGGEGAFRKGGLLKRRGLIERLQ